MFALFSSYKRNIQKIFGEKIYKIEIICFASYNAIERSTPILLTSLTYLQKILSCGGQKLFLEESIVKNKSLNEVLISTDMSSVVSPR